MLPTTFEWRGLTLGPATAYQSVRLDGWEDMPPLDSGDQPRPGRHGSWAGTPYSQERTITLTGRIRTGRNAILDRVRDLRRVCAVPDDAALYPLTITALGEALTVDARVSQRIIGLDKGARLGVIPFTLQWTAPDPARYDPDPVHLAVPPGGSRPAPQHGTTGSRPVITVHGPCTAFTITVTRPNGRSRRIGFTTQLYVDDTLTIDCHTGVVTSSWGDDVSGQLSTGSVPIEYLTIPTGSSTVSLAATSPGAACRAHVVYRHAYL